MKEPQFTPGPWYRIQEREHPTTTNDGHYLPKWGVYDNNQAWCIASTGSTWPTEEEEDANAALLAAAPELYAMVEKLTDELYCVLAVFAGDGDEDFPLVDEARLLLAKARGEEVEK